MFKSMKYESGVPNAFIGIMASVQGKEAAVDASPVRYEVAIGHSAGFVHDMGRGGQDDGQSRAEDTDMETTVPSSEGLKRQEKKAARDHSSSPRLTPLPKTKTIELRISHSSYPHTTSIRQSPLYGPYTPVPYNRSAIAADLSERIPNSIAKQGLCDWVTDSISASARSTGRSSEERVGGKGGVDWGRVGGSKGTTPWRILERERRAKEEAMLRGG